MGPVCRCWDAQSGPTSRCLAPLSTFLRQQPHLTALTLGRPAIVTAARGHHGKCATTGCQSFLTLVVRLNRAHTCLGVGLLLLLLLLACCGGFSHSSSTEHRARPRFDGSVALDRSPLPVPALPPVPLPRPPPPQRCAACHQAARACRPLKLHATALLGHCLPQRKHVCLDCWTNASLLTTLRRLLVSDVHAGFGKAGCLAYWRLELNGVGLGSAVPTGPASLGSYLLPASSSASPCALPRLRLTLRGLVGGQQPSSDDAMDTRRDRDTDVLCRKLVLATAAHG